jgi:hypothetical protein
VGRCLPREGLGALAPRNWPETDAMRRAVLEIRAAVGSARRRALPQRRTETGLPNRSFGVGLSVRRRGPAPHGEIAFVRMGSPGLVRLAGRRPAIGVLTAASWPALRPRRASAGAAPTRAGGRAFWDACRQRRGPFRRGGVEYIRPPPLSRFRAPAAAHGQLDQLGWPQLNCPSPPRRSTTRCSDGGSWAAVCAQTACVSWPSPARAS